MKNKKRQFKKVLLISFLAVFFSFIIGSGVLAAEEVKKSTGPSVSPPIINLSLKAGDVTESSFTYTNNSDKSQIISIDLRPFVPSDGEKGAPVFSDANGKTIISPFTDWIDLDKTSYEVSAHGEAEVNFNINVPKDAAAKKYYVAIVAGEKKSNTANSGSAISTEIGVLVVADVSRDSSPIKNIINQVKSYPWYFYAMIIAFILAVILAIVIYRRRD